MDRTEIKAILFDLDGVIVDTAKYHYLAWKVIADEMGIYFDETINERFKGVSRVDCLEILLENETKKYTVEEKELYASKKNSIYVAMLNDLTQNSVLPKMHDFIIDLKKHNLKCAICSVSKNALTILNKLQLTEMFDVIVGGNDIKNSKPDPEVFIKASDALHVPYENCLVIEDAQAGIEASKRGGMQSIGIGELKNLFGATKIVCCTEKMVFDELFENNFLKV